MFRNKTFLFIVLYLLVYCSAALARDIYLDDIYIKKSAPEYSGLLVNRLNAYRAVGGIQIDRDVIFAGWLSGSDIVYVKERASVSDNIIYKFSFKRRRRHRLARVPGTITSAQITPDGKRYLIKRLIRRGSVIPESELVILSLYSGSTTILKSRHVFIDYTISPGGDSILMESEKGIEERFLPGQTRRLILHRDAYRDISTSSSPTLAFLSPRRNNLLLLCGEGGGYRAKLRDNGGWTSLKGITSISELFWLDNQTIAYRGGYPNSYSVMLYNIQKKSKKTLLQSSMNTAISYSRNSQTLAFLKDQMIMFYYPKTGRLIHAGIEGEEIFFNSQGTLFTSLCAHRLFVVNVHALLWRQIILKRTWRKNLRLYRSLRGRRSSYENKFSQQYIDRRIRAYRKMIEE